VRHAAATAFCHDARRQLLALEQIFRPFFGSIGPHDLFGDADEIAQHAGPLGDRIPALRRADIRPHTADRSGWADHVKELMSREMRQLIKADQRNLRTLPLINRGLELQM
jgi:hypothetical protein